MTERFDAVVMGMGPAGEVAASRLLSQGLSVAVREAAGLSAIHRLAAKHFLQEDQAPAIAEHVANLAAGR